MDTAEQIEPVPAEPATATINEEGIRSMPTQRREIAAQALKELWQELLPDSGPPLIFASPLPRRWPLEHHPLLLDRLLADNKRKKTVPGQLKAWKMLDAPSYAQGIASVGEVSVLLKPDMVRVAEPGERGVIPAAPYGWIHYTFLKGWNALSVYFYDSDTNESHTLNAIPNSCQDEWLAFLQALNDAHEDIWRRGRRGVVEVLGGPDELAEAIKQASYNDIILPQATLSHIAAERNIFKREVLARYAALHIPRLRKVLLIGPPGTGKTTLLKAEAADHLRRDGQVFYVCASPSRNASPWSQLSYALTMAAESHVPSLVLVEDFELFVTNAPEMQQILNTLDGVATPDNPAGTLLLAATGDPEKIDQRIRDRTGRIDVIIEIGLVDDVEMATRLLAHFLGDTYRVEEHAPVAAKLLKQPGSHFREVCIAAVMHALEHGRGDVLAADLLWAHEVILTGKDVAEEAERFLPSPARKRGSYFGRT